MAKYRVCVRVYVFWVFIKMNIHFLRNMTMAFTLLALFVVYIYISIGCDIQSTRVIHVGSTKALTSYYITWHLQSACHDFARHSKEIKAQCKHNHTHKREREIELNRVEKTGTESNIMEKCVFAKLCTKLRRNSSFDNKYCCESVKVLKYIKIESL